MEAILLKLGINDYNKVYDKKIILSCPIHGGDNPTSCVLNISKELLVPTWSCYSHKCHESVGKTLLHFLSSVRKENIYDTIKWLNYSIDEEDVSDYLSFINLTNLLNEDYDKNLLPRNIVLSSIKIPAEYYILRNYKPEILERYDVGVCLNKNKPMYNRVVIPVYDDNREFMVGCVGRSIFEKCFLCDCYHDESKICPISQKDIVSCSKWKNSKGFKVENHFYNYWFAKNKIKETGLAFIVEGAGDVWRFVQSGIENVIGMFGSSLKPNQKKILEKSGAQKIITFTDPDEAGDKCRKNIEKSVGRLYEVDHIIYEKDPGECEEEEVLKLTGEFL
jgi:5S rRNA maturation endonuclease (ribonuclease M5)